MRKPVLLWPLLAGLGLLAGLAGCSSARPPERAARAPAAAASAGPVATTALFDFYESPWLGLHHFLYQWAVAEETPARRAFRVVPVPETAELAQLAPEEREAWQQALDHYRQTWIGRDLLFDQDLVAIKQKLSALPASPDVFLTGLPTDLATALSKAMPVYRRHWWVRHQAADAAWIEGLVPRLRKLEIPLLRRIADVYGGRLPAGRLRVDVAAYADWAQAYTNETGTVVASADQKNQGPASLEVILHETSHRDSLEGPLRTAIAAAFAKVGAREPRDLWHVLIFYTAGEVTREALRGEGIADYQAMADRLGLYRGRWSRLHEVVGRHWGEVLAGRLDRATVLARIANDLTAAPAAGLTPPTATAPGAAPRRPSR